MPRVRVQLDSSKSYSRKVIKTNPKVQVVNSSSKYLPFKNNVNIFDYSGEKNDFLKTSSLIFGSKNIEDYQIQQKISEGSFGMVYKARNKKTSNLVAMKKIKLENYSTQTNQDYGFPVNLLREIKTLSMVSHHENVIGLHEILTNSNMDQIYIIMDLAESDLFSSIENMRRNCQNFGANQVRNYIQQLLKAIAFLHGNGIIHRDLKTSNLLLTQNEVLKVADFGLARKYDLPATKSYTPMVVTLWYRAPELLLGLQKYSTFIDVWSVGCIFAELVMMNPVFPGVNEYDQIKCIFQSLGTPDEKIWPGYNDLPIVKDVKLPQYSRIDVETKFQPYRILSEDGADLLRHLIIYDPKLRISCHDALQHSYFNI